MVMFWDRRLVYTGVSFNDFNKVLDALAIAEIENTRRSEDRTPTKVKNQARFGDRVAPTIMYYVYVHKIDSEKARETIKALDLGI